MALRGVYKITGIVDNPVAMKMKIYLSIYLPMDYQL